MKKREKKGVSPVIATTLLIAIVVVLAVIIFLWARGFVSESVQKFDRAVEFSCDSIDFDTEIVNVAGDYELDVVNNGNVPLYGFDVKKLGKGEVLTNEILDNTISIGGSATVDIPNDASYQTGDEFLVVPIILGSSDKGKVPFTCPDQYGFATAIV